MLKSTTTYHFICDRCGKERHIKEHESVNIHSVKVCSNDGFMRTTTLQAGDICEECFKDFCERAESFFDDLNKTEKGGEAE